MKIAEMGGFQDSTNLAMHDIGPNRVSVVGIPESPLNMRARFMQGLGAGFDTAESFK